MVALFLLCLSFSTFGTEFVIRWMTMMTLIGKSRIYSCVLIKIMLINRYSKCSINVKLTLFLKLSVCQCMICVSRNIILSLFIKKCRYCYNKCIKKFCGYSGRDSMSRILILPSLPTADTLLHNSRIVLRKNCVCSCNKIVTWLVTVGLWSVLLVICFFFIFTVLFLYKPSSI